MKPHILKNASITLLLPLYLQYVTSILFYFFTSIYICACASPSEINHIKMSAVQVQNDELRSKQASAGAAKTDLPTIQMVDFKTKFAEVKAYTKVYSLAIPHRSAN